MQNDQLSIVHAIPQMSAHEAKQADSMPEALGFANGTTSDNLDTIHIQGSHFGEEGASDSRIYTGCARVQAGVIVGRTYEHSWKSSIPGCALQHYCPQCWERC